MPNEVVGNDSSADPVDPNDQDGAKPDNSPDWNVRQALAWIIWRRLPSPELRPMLKDRLDAAYDYDDEATPEAKDLNKEVTTALDELNHAVMADRIVARARPSHSPTTPNEHWPRIPIPANTIDERRRIGVSGWCQIRTDAPFDEWMGDPGPFFYDVCFKAGDVKRLWKPPSKRPPKPPIPWADLLKWWHFEYLKKHSDPDKRPTVAEQHEAAKAQFPNHAPPTFEQMKKLRAHPGTPGEWSEGGRRPKSG